MTQDKFDTLRVHAGYKPEENQFASSVPIYQTAAFGLSNTEVANQIVAGQQPGRFDYSRDGNPTVHVYEQRIAALEGGIDAVAALLRQPTFTDQRWTNFETFSLSTGLTSTLLMK